MFFCLVGAFFVRSVLSRCRFSLYEPFLLRGVLFSRSGRGAPFLPVRRLVSGKLRNKLIQRNPLQANLCTHGDGTRDFFIPAGTAGKHDDRMTCKRGVPT